MAITPRPSWPNSMQITSHSNYLPEGMWAVRVIANTRGNTSRFVTLILILLAGFSPSNAQGLFHTYVESRYPSAPNVNRLWGSFTLDDQRLFRGLVDVEFGVQGDLVQIFRSTSSQTPGEPLFALSENGGFFPTGD